MNPWNVGPTDLGVSSSMLTKSMKDPRPFRREVDFQLMPYGDDGVTLITPDCKYDLENAQVLELCRGLLEVSNYYEKSSS